MATNSGPYEKYPAFPGHDTKTDASYTEHAHNLMESYSAIKSDANNKKLIKVSDWSPANGAKHSPHGLHPNVVRIEVLTPAARRRYLNGGLGNGNVSYQAEEDVCRQLMMDTFTEGGEYYKPFYGITDQTNENVSFSFRSAWSNSDGGSSSIGGALAKGAEVTGDAIDKGSSAVNRFISGFHFAPASLAGGILSKVGNGIGKGVNWLGEHGSKVGGMIEGITDSVGLDYKSSGACTLRKFKNSAFEPNKSITCKWYMPEQEHLARLSIGRLLRMSYARSLKPGLGPDEYRVICQLVATSRLEAVSNAIENNLDNKGKNDSVFAGITDLLSTGAQKGTDVAESALSGLGSQIGTTLNGALNAFGSPITLDPLPVRLTVGHILDVEPLVITEVNVTCSKEQFVSPDGSHIPLFITAKISFEMWMTPNPNTGFIQFMGDPLFKLENTYDGTWVSRANKKQ